MRKKLFVRCKREHEAQQKRFKLKQSHWLPAFNKFSDRTEEERAKSLGKKALRSRHLLAAASRNPSRPGRTPAPAPAIFSLPYPNWTTLYGPIQDQGQCGSCWAFTAAGMLESYATEKSPTHLIQRLSTRNLINCDKNNYGCNGGWVDDAFIYVRTQ